MQISSVSFLGRKTKPHKKHSKQTVKVQIAKVSPDKQIRFSAPNDYEIYMRPYLKETSLIKEVKDSFEKSPATSSNTDSSKASSNSAKTNDKDEYGLPKEISEGIDNIVDVESDTKDENKKNGLKKTIKKVAAVIYSLTLIAGSILGTSFGKDAIAKVPESAVVDYNNEEDSLEGIADAYNIDEGVIRYVNNIDNEEDLKELSKITIPSKYSYIDDEIEETVNTLYKNKNIDDAALVKYGNNIDALMKKKEAQEEIAEMYTDGETVYIKIKNFKDEPELAEKYSKTTLTDDSINELFDIKDGELRKYNTFQNGKKDGFTLSAGTIIKVPASAIDTENIDISDYRESN